MTNSFLIREGEVRHDYLGDAVYASYDGFHIWLRTGDGNNNEIALDPDVFTALIRYEKDLRAAQRARNLTPLSLVATSDDRALRAKISLDILESL